MFNTHAYYSAKKKPFKFPFLKTTVLYPLNFSSLLPRSTSNLTLIKPTILELRFL